MKYYKLSSEEKNVILKFRKSSEHTCSYCGKELEHGQVRVDHIIPVSRGGLTILENLCISCEPCNTEKGSKTKEEFYEYLKYKDWLKDIGYDKAYELFRTYTEMFRTNNNSSGYKSEGLKLRWKVSAIRRVYGIR